MNKNEFRERLMEISAIGGDGEALQENLLELATAFDDRFDEVERLKGDLSRVVEERDEAQRKYRERFFSYDGVPQESTQKVENAPESVTIEDLFKEE